MTFCASASISVCFINCLIVVKYKTDLIGVLVMQIMSLVSYFFAYLCNMECSICRLTIAFCPTLVLVFGTKLTNHA